jgi:hypothetical protein
MGSQLIQLATLRAVFSVGALEWVTLLKIERRTVIAAVGVIAIRTKFAVCMGDTSIWVMVITKFWARLFARLARSPEIWPGCEWPGQPIEIKPCGRTTAGQGIFVGVTRAIELSCPDHAKRIITVGT